MSIKTNNPGYGFYGTINGDADKAWGEAIEALAEATDTRDERRVAVFLDSRRGRHFADQVNGEGLAATISCWLGWKPSRAMRREFGLADHVDYLTAEIAIAWRAHIDEQAA